jgi:hypothetical protein
VSPGLVLKATLWTVAIEESALIVNGAEIDLGKPDPVPPSLVGSDAAAPHLTAVRAARVVMLVPDAHLVQLLDTGTTLALIPSAAAQKLYGAIPGAKFDSANNVFILPVKPRGIVDVGGEDLALADVAVLDVLGRGRDVLSPTGAGLIGGELAHCEHLGAVAKVRAAEEGAVVRERHALQLREGMVGQAASDELVVRARSASCARESAAIDEHKQTGAVRETA